MPPPVWVVGGEGTSRGSIRCGGRELECWKACTAEWVMPLEGGPRCEVVGTSLGFC